MRFNGVRREIPLCVVLACIATVGITGEQTMTRVMPALGDSFPKPVFYRYANNFKVTPGQENAAYEAWWAEYGRAMGVELDSRVSVTTDGRRQVIERVKNEHPDFLLIYYSTGHIKHPAPDTDIASGRLSDYSHGHWAYLPRVRILRDIPKEEGETTLRFEPPAPARATSAAADDEDVASAKTPSLFSLRKDRGDDICLYALGPDGRPDWDNAEQVTLVGLDEKAGIIKVRRGCYGTKPRAFHGQVYAAVHVEVVKHHGWRYNFSTHCPRDRNGRSAGDVWAASYAAIFQPGGIAEHFDALQLDTLSDTIEPSRGLDLNNNGVNDADEPSGGVNWFAVGLLQTLEKLRKGLPPHVLLIPDACNPGYQYVNGWEVEGFPGRFDPAWRGYSRICNRLELSRHLCREPRYTHVQHKIFNYAVGIEGAHETLGQDKLPFHLSRAVMALATIHEAALTWYSRAPLEADGRVGIYDELRMGQAQRPGWLGKPVDEPIYPGLSAPNLCPGVTTKSGIVAADQGTVVSVGPDGLTARHEGPAYASRLRLKVVCPSPEMLVRIRLRGDRRAGVPVVMPRAMNVVLTGGEFHDGYLIPSDPARLRRGLVLAGGEVRSVSDDRNAGLGFQQDFHVLRLGAQDPGLQQMFWQVSHKAPPDGRLSFWTFAGTGKYSVQAAEVKPNGAVGEFKTLVPPFAPNGPCAFHRGADLAQAGLGGKQIELRFLCEARDGRAQGTWGEVTLASPIEGGELPAGPTQRAIDGSFGEQSVNQTFHFNHVPANSPLTLVFEFEGREEVVIERLSIHPACGAIARQFEHGVILCNPSPCPFTFDLGALFPGKSYQRFLATPNQDKETNNGQPVGAQVRLGEFDALFLSLGAN